MPERPESTVLALGQTQLSPPRSPSTGETNAVRNSTRYTPVGLLGQGGMGVVHRIWDGDLMRELALKQMRPELRGDPALAAQFLWEARVTAYLDHPNIVPIHDLGLSPEGELFFTMKWAHGLPLDVALERVRAQDPELVKRLPLRRRLRLLHQICAAIGFAHGRGVLHRDLKPGNVILGEHGEVLVMDWGLAIPLPGAEGDRIRAVMPAGIANQSAGTPLYMSPEQARGEPLDARSDVFTLGVMLYELAALARPFEGGSVREVTERVAACQLRPLKEAWPEAPAPLLAVVERALQPDRAQRYPSAAALADDLEKVMEGGTPQAEQASSITRAARYYMGRDRGMALLRVVDIGLWMAAACLSGIGLGLLFHDWLASHALAASGASFAASLGLGFGPTRRWLALRKSGELE